MSSYFMPSNPGWGAASTAAKKKKTTSRPKPAPGTSPRASAPPPPDPYAQAQASVDEIIRSMLASVQQEKEMAYQSAQREAEMERAKGQALAEGLKALGISEAVQKAFGNAATAQAGLAQGFSGATRDQAAAQAAEQQRLLSGTGQEGAVRSAGEAMGNVQYGLGGQMPGTALNTMAAAFGADAALQPGFAMQFGAVNEAKRRGQWADEELPEWTKAISEVLDKKPGLLQDAFDQVWDQQMDVARLSGSSSSKSSKNTIRNLANGQLQAFNPQGKPVGKPYGPVRTTKADTPSPTKLQAKPYGDGRYIAWDPTTGKTVGKPFGTRKPKGKSGEGSSSNLQLKTVGKRQAWFDPRTGKRVGPWMAARATSRSTRSDGRPDGMTPTQVRSARADAFKIVNGWNLNGRKDDEGNDYRAQDLLKYMIQEQGIPFDIAVRVLATKVPAARKWYKPSRPVKPEKGAKVMPASFRSTHETDNLGWPAVDIMGKPGTPVASPVSGTIVRHGSAQGGQALYLRADDGTMYWLGHIDGMLPVGTRVRRGQTVARISGDHSAPHVHLAKAPAGTHI